MGKANNKDKRKTSAGVRVSNSPSSGAARIGKRRMKRKPKRINRSSSTSSLESAGASTEVDKGDQAKHRHNVREPKCTLEDLKGIDGVKQTLIEQIIWPFGNPDKARALKAEIPKGILLTGQPGTGKTCLADGIVSEIVKEGRNVRYYEETGAILDSYLGESEKKFRNLFQTAAETAPSVIFFDELDGLGGKRGETSATSTMNTIVTTFLTEMNKIENGKVLIIAATNHPELCDQALIRPGRFDIRLDLQLPDLDARMEIMQHYFHKKEVNVDSKELKKICREMKDFSGSDLKSVVERSWTSFMNRIFPNGVWRTLSVQELEEKLQPGLFDIGMDARGAALGMTNAMTINGVRIKPEPMEIIEVDDEEFVKEPEVQEVTSSTDLEDNSNIIQEARDLNQNAEEASPVHDAEKENVEDEPIVEDTIYGDFQKLPDQSLQKIFSYLDWRNLKNCSVLSRRIRKLVFPSIVASSSFCLRNESEINDFVDFLQTKIYPFYNPICFSIYLGDFKESILLELLTKCGSTISHLKVTSFFERELGTDIEKYDRIAVSGNKLLPNLESIYIVLENNSSDCTAYSYDKSYEQLKQIHLILGNAPAVKEIKLKCFYLTWVATLLFKFIEEFGLGIKILEVNCGCITDIGLGCLKNLSLEEVDFHASFELNEANSFTSFLESQRRTLKHLRLDALDGFSPIPEFTLPRMEMLETLDLSAEYVHDIGGPKTPISYNNQAPKLKTIILLTCKGIINEDEFFPCFISESTRSVKEVIIATPNIHSSNIIKCGRLFECLTILAIPVHEGLVCVWKDLCRLEVLKLFPSEVDDKKIIWIDETITGISVGSAGRNSVLTDEEIKDYERMYKAERSIEMLKNLRLLQLYRTCLDSRRLMLTDLPFRIVFNKMESLECIDFCIAPPSFIGASKKVLDEAGKTIDLLFGDMLD